jgi:hypothetical protein
MKDSKKYSQALKKFIKKSKSEFSVPPTEHESEIDLVVRAGIYEIAAFDEAESIYKKLDSHFVDWNDLRVSRFEEVKDVLGQDCVEPKLVAENLKTALNAIFDKYDCLSLEMILEKGKRDARRELEAITGLSSYIIDFFMLTAMGAQHLPLSGRMVDYVKFADLVHPGSKDAEIRGFLERQIPVNELYSLYCYIKTAADAADMSEFEEKKAQMTAEDAGTEKKSSKSSKTKAKTASPKKKTAKPAEKAKDSGKKAVKKTPAKKAAPKKAAVKKTASKTKAAKKKTAANKK